ncbi:uncharacterized protein LOC110838648 [Zootermopsis nevadensis]|uniref:uncharacterized protein LOC110838648 n=1 Tax=Zootermopsis nevadensis TaxID=136037 RepID=UPI000B8E63CE|nr:uncharacterized protein LOC110838648 [Zootermopsis nevadensis]XP_021937710.1 uncharacterized protein LOC110838648 [Zootermopsis nevadensis]
MIPEGRGSSGSPSTPPYSEYHHQHPYQQAYHQPSYKHPPHSHHTHHPTPPSPPSSPSSASSTRGCCNLRRGICCNNGNSRPRRRRGSSWCCCCFCPSSVLSSAFSSLGVCVLVVGYTLLGAFTFMALEGGFKDTSHLSSSNLGTSSGSSSTSSSSASNSKSISDKSVVLGEEIRSRTVEKLWSITEDLNILYKDNWTRLAAQEVLKFQDTLVRNLRVYGGGGVIIKTGSGAANGGSIYYNHQHHRWSFSSSFLYSLTLITTIGYGSVAPRTPWGKVITIIYALIGIPLMLVYLSTVGDVLARNFRRLYCRVCGNGGDAGGCNGRSNSKNTSGKNSMPARGSSTAETYLSTGYTPSLATKAHNSITADGSALKMHHYHPHATPGADRGDDIQAKLDRTGSVVVLDCGGEGIGESAASSSTALDPGRKRRRTCGAEHVRIPISLCLLIIVVYICGGALLFNRLENWTFLEGSYFCFTSLGTIGFGDLIPGLYHSYQVQYQTSASHSSAEQLSVFASSAYILVGMALIAMCFNLVQDEVVIIVRKLGHYFGVASPSTFVSSSSRGGDLDDEDVMIDVVDGEEIAMAVVSSSGASS